MRTLHRFAPVALGAGFLFASPAAVAEVVAPTSLGAAVDTAALGGLRGGADHTTNQMHLQGTTSGNSADRVITGNNAIGQGSFAGMSGIPLVVQNTGANVLIQNAVIVNVKMN